MSTDCPGKNLYSELATIIGKTNWYRYSTPDVVDKPVEPPIDVEKISSLSAKYESNGNPACVADNAGDLGGISYVKYQFA